MTPANDLLERERINARSKNRYVTSRPAMATGGRRSRQAGGLGAAEGGDDPRPLVTMANNSSASQRRRRRRAIDLAQALIRETCGHLSQAKRIIRCGRAPTGAGRIMVAKHQGRPHMSGLQTCGSVWACAACSYKIRVKRAVEIALVTMTHMANGGGVLHIVVTMPHRAGEELDRLWRIISDCWAHVTSGGGWQSFKDRHDVLGFIRATEVTHSNASGWHPHCHILLFVGEPISPCENEDGYYALRKAIRDRWTKRMAEEHGRTMSTEFGIRVDPVKPDEADGSGQYLTKVGYEMAMVDSKVGRGDGHRTPFAIAHDAAENGDMADVELFREWITASHRKHSIAWSKGLREAFDLGPERSDEELASESVDGEPVIEIHPALWHLIARRRDGARSGFLTCFEIDDHHQAVTEGIEFLRRLGIAAVVDETGRTPVLGLDHPPTPNTGEQHPC